ncbi:MAG TPA: thioredoxin domain-containing protein [Solirubrobacteraceae bacterium]|nr:thioredoxin domain-containing protein [Solirubrobacteraceae bacterium]
MANALAAEASPYLRQHADNPVDWLPWGAEAIERARERDLPLFVSIGYAACHWCHVMEHESFSDPATAALMNERFVCVKVDREERPDIDGVYMEAVQLMTGHGGWPLNVFLTPDQTPFFGGTYWPPQPRHGMPAFPQVLASVAELWSARRDEACDVAARLTERLRETARLEARDLALDEEVLVGAVARLRESYDERNGGFGGAPKFPPHCTLELLLRRGELEMSTATLRAMARGGICDQVGGGFARYSVDATWTVPHFEKMLYDNALLARAYLHGWQLSGEELLARTARETLDFCLRELRADDGSFYCSLDADSEGVEGRYYLWTLQQLEQVLGENAQAAIDYFGASAAGNFEGANVLVASGPEPPDRSSIRELLRAARERRVRPALDDKRLTAWNALMIGALADAGAALADPVYLDAAVAAAEFVWREMRERDGRLLRSYGEGGAHVAAFLEDHAFLLEALLTLYESTFDERFFVWSVELADALLDRFRDAERGGFFVSARDGERLIAERKELEDHPIPAGSSSAALGLLRLAALSGERRYEDAALGAIGLGAEIAPRFPTTFAYLLCAADFYLADVKEIALVGPNVAPFARLIRDRFLPHIVLAGAAEGATSKVPLLASRSVAKDVTAAFVCERFACQAPLATPSELASLFGWVHEPTRGSVHGGCAA